MTTPSISVLYDVPGPRARRVTWIASTVFAVLAAAGLYLFAYRPLAEQGQFDWALWAPLLDPSTPEFPQVWRRLWEGFRNTIIAAVLAIITSLVFGTVLAILRVRLAEARHAGLPRAASRRAIFVVQWVLNGLTRVFVEFFRGLPVVVTIFFVARALPGFGINLEPRSFLVIGLTLYNMVVIGEILRAGMTNLPRGQKEAADALGLGPMQTILSILLPQSYRIMLPALISQLVVVLKDTSLGFIISYEEILRVTGQLIQVLGNPIQSYAVIAVIYILVNYLLSRLAVYTQRRIARGRKTGKAAPPSLLTVELEAEAGTTGRSAAA